MHSNDKFYVIFYLNSKRKNISLYIIVFHSFYYIFWIFNNEIRDASGEWLAGYARNIGSCSIAWAELWGVLNYLNLAWDLGWFKQGKVEVKSKFVIEEVHPQGVDRRK